ncbi:SDR family oxidoreductase [Streptomyces sp. NBC_01497]|uniref:SDR family oxidoreductase n=1 Tax=Streptomyces sp. NBC_01497 TaxID=2903885 RepID=UPI002E2EC321|nr:SDR family oxidoreductase [Streptomyces sp. NBC_01497]
MTDSPRPTPRTVPSGRITLDVAEFGSPGPDRPTVLLVHGYPDSKEVWLPVARRLAPRFHVALYDVRGHGHSAAPHPLRGGFTLDRLTDDFLAVADAVSPDRPVHLVGHDWGSVQGWEFATSPRTRGRVASFTSLSGPSLDHLGHWLRDRAAERSPRAAAQLLAQGAKSWYVYALHTPALPELAWRGPLGRRWPAMLRRAENLPETGGEDVYPAPTLAEDAANGAWLYRDNVRARLRDPRPDAHAHVPVQLIVPTGDPYLSERLYDDLDRWVPRLTRRTVRAKHWLPRTRPDQLSTWIADFVTDRERDGEGTEDAGHGETSARGEDLARGEGPARGGQRGHGREPATGAGPVPGARLPGARLPGTGKDTPAAQAGAARFAGRLILVTGAASGIGRATVLAFARAGARVVAVDIDGEGAARTAGEARAAGAREAWPEHADVGDEHAMEALAARVEKTYGVPDVLVNNAGIGMSGSFLDTTAEDWRKVLDANLWGVIHGCRLFGRLMAERGQGGHIVNTASAAAFQPSRALPAYSTSKAAVLMLSECLRAELAERDIGVSAVCPGFVHTGITATARFTGVSDEEQERLRHRTTRLYALRDYPPERVADAVLRAVVRNDAVVPVTPEAYGLRALARLSRGARAAIARREPPL